MENRERIGRLLQLLEEGIFEKEHVVALSMLSAIAGESIFLLGPPGTGKSMIARRLKQAFRSGASFEYLMSRFSTPDEIFGPVSIAALKDEGRYARLTEGYLPSADVVFLDEIWKAGPSIQNALLTVLNEKVYLNGKEEMRLPLKLVVAASNELPAEGENLGALWDRFLVRCLVGGIADRRLFNLMVASPEHAVAPVPEPLRLSAEELAVWSEGIDAVQLPDFVFFFIHCFRSKLADFNARAEESGERPFYVSDRRWRKLARLWRASAFLNGRSAVSLSDLPLLRECVWDEPGQLSALDAMLADALEATCEERSGYPLLAERLAALKEMGGRRPPAAPPFKVVKAFFYQVRPTVAGRTVLVYASEYDALDAQRPTPFILTYDRRKTGAQILRRYEPDRHPGVLPKDLLQVVRADVGLLVNGRLYELLRDESAEAASLPPAGHASDGGGLSPQLAERMLAELEAAQARLAEWEGQEQAHAVGNLFLDQVQRDLLSGAFRRLRERLEALRIDVRELQHAVGK